MRLKKLNCFLIFPLVAIMTSCVYEQPPVFYHFRIINHTQEKINIESESVVDRVLQNDSLEVDSAFAVKIMNLRCYGDYYKDTLIRTFFKTLKLSSSKAIVLDPYRRSNWKETVKLRSDDYCSGADVYYELDVKK